MDLLLIIKLFLAALILLAPFVSFFVGILGYREREDLPEWTRVRVGIRWIIVLILFEIAADFTSPDVRVPRSNGSRDYTLPLTGLEPVTLLIYGWFFIHGTRGAVGMYLDAVQKWGKKAGSASSAR